MNRRWKMGGGRSADSELLDSLGFISLLDGLEDIGISIQPTQVDRNEFRTLDGIFKSVQEIFAVNKPPQRQKLKSLRQFLLIESMYYKRKGINREN